MATTLGFLLFSILVIFTIAPSIDKTSFNPKALFIPITKDSATSLYITHLHQGTPLVPTNLVIDLSGQFLWVVCEEGYISSTYRPVHCKTPQCSITGSKLCGDCFLSKPGCNPNTCRLMPNNIFTRTGIIGEVAADVVSIQSTNGSNPGKMVTVPKFLFACGARELLQGLPDGVKGMAGFGRNQMSLPSQFASAFNFHNKFAICLTSSTSVSGVMFFGNGPYVFYRSGFSVVNYSAIADMIINDQLDKIVLSSTNSIQRFTYCHINNCTTIHYRQSRSIFLPGIDVSKSLIYTPLIENPDRSAGPFFHGRLSAEYFIGVKSIRINGKSVPLNPSLLEIGLEGEGGTKISTINPYTVMESSIYRVFLNTFASELENVPKVEPVAPFGLCFNSTHMGSTRVGPSVPPIDLVLQSEDVYWRIFGANSMVQVSSEVSCLAFVDGGVDITTSIVIGSHQLQDKLLEFDLANSRLGISSSLLLSQISCANFNFTLTSTYN